MFSQFGRFVASCLFSRPGGDLPATAFPFRGITSSTPQGCRDKYFLGRAQDVVEYCVMTSASLRFFLLNAVLLITLSRIDVQISLGDLDPQRETRTQNMPRHHFRPLPPSSDLSLLSRSTLFEGCLTFTGRSSVISRKRQLRVELLFVWLRRKQVRLQNAHHGRQQRAYDGRD